IQVGETVGFTGSASDPDGRIAGYAWTFGGGAPNSSLEDPGPVTFTRAGLFTVVFNATDNLGAVDGTPDFRQVEVSERPTPLNQPPDAVIDDPSGSVTIQAGQGVSFAGTGVDGDGSIASYAWSFPGGSPAASGVEDPGFVVFPAAGVFIVTLTVTDNGELVDLSPPARTITVTAPGTANQPPDAAIVSPPGNLTIQVGTRARFAGRASDPDGTVTSFAWSFGGAAPPSGQLVPGEVLFGVVGVFTVTFNVTDNGGFSDPTPDRRIITVTQGAPSNTAPNASIDLPAGPVTIGAGQSVTFQGSASDPDGSIAAFQWDFGGGAPPSSAEDPGTVTFGTAGTYLVTFNVTDREGASDPTPATVRVVVTGEGGGGGGEGEFNVEASAPGSANRVDGHDVIFILRAIATQDLRADVSGDGKVDSVDVQLVLAAMGDVD
ncbi:MAG: PKD domain-containing protein, partial [Gemmatimonadetes bacterium]|nr:PKD domain-containing protein [Gemmatimonadota bacterium]